MSAPQTMNNPSPTTSGPQAKNRLAHFGLGVMRWLAVWPLPLLRGLGWALGHLLYALAARRRRIALVNWALCFPQDSEAARRRAVRRHFVVFTQAWLDRSWLWEGSPQRARERLRMVGATEELAGDGAVLVFAPHFVGLDAGGTALALNFPRRFISLYARQRNAVVDGWIRAGRLRFGDVRLVEKHQSLKSLVQALRAGEVLYLLPDMDMGPAESVFVPFFGVQTATVPTLPRLAQLGRARVVPVISRMTATGYDVEVLPGWEAYPSGDTEADTAEMNARLEAMIRTMPEQYYWVHKRFKTRPPGQPSPYVASGEDDGD